MATFAPQSDQIYVAVTASLEEARSFVHVDLAGLPDAAVAASSLVLQETADSLLPDGATIVACALAEPLRDSGQLEGELPPSDCTVRTEAVRDASGAWTVELGIFAPRWMSVNNGMVLLPDSSQVGATFRVAWSTDASDFVTSIPTTTPDRQTDTGPPANTVEGDVGRAHDPPAPMRPASTPAPRPPPYPPQPEPPAVAGAPMDSVQVPRVVQAEHVPPVGRSTAGSAILAMSVIALGAAVVGGLASLRRSGTSSAGRILSRERVWPVGVALFAGVALLPLLGRESIVFKAGVVLIFFVAALGLHVLVNWAGQLSLAHAGMVGLPAFATLAVSEVYQISPLYLLPVAVLIGAAVGGIVALPTLRARGLQVTLVTLVVGIAIDRFFFTQTWLVGTARGRAAATPSLGPFQFTTSRSLYLLLLAIVALTLACTWLLMHSKLARAWYWVRTNPEAASASGIPVVFYRVLAFTIGGAFAGLAGGLSVMWIQRLSSGAFPTTLSFTYLLVAVLAGNGFVGGVAAATVMIQGGAQFAENLFGVAAGRVIDIVIDYVGPAGLIFVVVAHQTGFNGFGRHIMRWIRDTGAGQARLTRRRTESERVSIAFVAGAAFIVAGFVAIGLAWTHIRRIDQLWVQNQEMLSGGIGGLALVLVGVGLLIRDQLSRNHANLSQQLAELAEMRGALQGGDQTSEGQWEDAAVDARPARGHATVMGSAPSDQGGQLTRNRRSTRRGRHGQAEAS